MKGAVLVEAAAPTAAAVVVTAAAAVLAAASAIASRQWTGQVRAEGLEAWQYAAAVAAAAAVERAAAAAANAAAQAQSFPWQLTNWLLLPPRPLSGGYQRKDADVHRFGGQSRFRCRYDSLQTVEGVGYDLQNHS